MKHISIHVLCMIIVAISLRGQTAPTLVPDTLPARIPEILPESVSGLRIVPKDSPLRSEVIELGRRIFFDPVLSKNKTVACASCHRPEFGFASNDAVAIGIDGQIGTRNSPTLFNRGFGGPSFWDGRVSTLEEQVLEPISNPIELGHSLQGVLATMSADKSYQAEFKRAFGNNAPSGTNLINAEHLSRSLATFLRSLVLADSPVDRFHRGDSSALTKIEKRGLWLFESRGGCWQCHTGFNFSDESFHNTGIASKSKNPDAGRMVVTKKKKHARAFKTPTLRGVAATAPYMHNGSLKSLRDVVVFYNEGGNPKDESLDRKIRPLGLDPDDVDALVALLNALSRNEFDTSRKAKSKAQPSPTKK